MDAHLWLWVGFGALVLFLLALDLGVMHREDRAISTGEALTWTGFYIALALLFNGLVYFLYEHHWLGAGEFVGADIGGRQAAIEFLTAWLLEKSLSLDNIFVIAVIFEYFGVPDRLQHRVLFWGILGALVMRGVMIGAGVTLINRFDWVVYVFGFLLIFTAVKMLVARQENVHPDRNILVRVFRRLYRVTADFRGSRFFVREGGRRAMTPLFLALLVVESTDLLFAVDSIPAVIAVTRDPFLVYTSNVFAILGLRALYFALAGLIARFRYLKTSLVFVLAYIGLKMIFFHEDPLPSAVSLGIVVGILALGIGASLVAGLSEPEQETAAPEAEGVLQRRLTEEEAKRAVVLLIGLTVLFLGLIMLVGPGPGLVVSGIGATILAAEYQWARSWLRRMRRRGGRPEAETAGEEAAGRRERAGGDGAG